jgi:hypothetical protein
MTTATAEPQADEVETEEKGKRGRKRDFSKSSEHYDQLAEFINTNPDYIAAGLTAIKPLQVKAILALKTDFANQPELKAARDAAKAKRDEEAKKYEGMSEEQIKAHKAAARAEAQVNKHLAKADEARKKAEELKAAASGSGEDLAAVVGAAQNGAEEKPRKGLRR